MHLILFGRATNLFFLSRMRRTIMKLDALLKILSDNPATAIQLLLPDGSFVPAHFHVTEIGLVRKDFVDCGGTVRSSSSCVLQAWVASDVDHRLDTGKLNRIFQLAIPILKSTELPVEVEYENQVVSQYPVTSAEITQSGLLLQLGSKHTACLAPDLCGLIVESGCGSSNCC